MATCSDYFSAALRSDNPVRALDSICALDRGASVTALSERFGLPHHATPGGPPDRTCVGAAWAALAGGRTGEPMTGPGIPEARSHLAAHRRALGMGTEAEAAGGITFDDPIVSATFRVDPDNRTISGLLVPWGKVARAGFARWRFPRGSLRWVDESRVKLNNAHDRKEAIAVATRLRDIAAGLEGVFKVARGEDGDKALSKAEDRVLDGFSIEVDFEDGTGDGWVPDPADEGVRLVTQAKLVGCALTGFPAFDDARVARVVAARQRGGAMGEKDSDQADMTDLGRFTLRDEAEGAVRFEQVMAGLAEKITESHRKLTEDLAASVGESISAGMKVALEDMSPQAGPQPVRASRYVVTREEPVYRFNGEGHSLVRDAWYAARERDDEAVERLRRYRVQSEEVAKLSQRYGGLGFTPQSTSTAAAIIPPGYRPDLYVPQLGQDRPLVALASQGVIQNATPFTVPVFTSATSATADHVEGTNPSDGSISLTTKTVTPQAISGRLVLTREIVDSSNPAIDQIAMAAMRESYARQTEGKVYTLLNGANGAGGTITAGFVPSGAQAATYVGATGTPPALIGGIRARLAAYPFNRFASPNGVAMGQNATAILATAVDTTGRPIFPSVGATNAAGLGNAASQAWSVDGLAFVPAWAITGTAAGDTQIFIVNSADLWVWESPLLTFRFEEKQGPANIELNVFGYFATHLLRPVGLSGIRIT
jgi:HK97 family phage major capsid protein